MQRPTLLKHKLEKRKAKTNNSSTHNASILTISLHIEKKNVVRWKANLESNMQDYMIVIKCIYKHHKKFQIQSTQSKVIGLEFPMFGFELIYCQFDYDFMRLKIKNCKISWQTKVLKNLHQPSIVSSSRGQVRE